MNQPLAALRRQLQTLKAAHASGSLDDAAYESQRAAVERQIVDGVMSGEAQAKAVADKPPRPSRRLLATTFAVVFGIAAAGYWWAGSPALIGGIPPSATESANNAGASGGEEQGTTPPHLTMEQIAGLVDKLATRLKERPDDVEGWTMLGRSYSLLGRNADAVAAYEKAVKLRADDARLLADYADALAVKNNRSMAGEPIKLVERALAIEPENLKALSLAGTAAFERGDYAGAVDFWQRMLKPASGDARLTQQIQSSIAEARTAGHLPGATGTPGTPTAAATTTAAGAVSSTTPTSPQTAAAAAVTGTVTLAPALAAKAKPDDTLFVYARAPSGAGPRMPLAVLRKQVKDLPLQFRLDDSLAMSPAARLSSVPQVIISARISARGEALPQPGDLAGQAGPVAVGSNNVNVEIAEVVPPAKP